MTSSGSALNHWRKNMGSKFVATTKYWLLWLFVCVLVVFVVLPLLPFFILYLLVWGLLEVADEAIIDAKKEKDSE